ncbi:MAG: NADPH:quinone reductase [Bryobacterales bacterium]|nr:NADPH:quinone reductase [Bryobacterales bacterium]
MSFLAQRGALLRKKERRSMQHGNIATLQKPTVLVLGASGQIGRFVVQQLDPTPGEVHVRTRERCLALQPEGRASGPNFIELYVWDVREGRYGKKPRFTAGQEASGTIVALGANVAHLKEGDRVAWCSVPGTCAEYDLAPAFPDFGTKQKGVEA